MKANDFKIIKSPEIESGHPLAALLGKQLFGIESRSTQVQRLMVSTAIKAAVWWHENEMKKASNEGTIHVLPINDSKEHIESRDCPCRPRVETYPNGGVVIIHNAWDGRK